MKSFLLRCLIVATFATSCLVPASGALAATGVCDTGNNIDVEATGGTAQTGYATLAAAFTAISAGTHQATIVVEVCANTAEPATGAILGASGVGGASYTSILIKPVGGLARTITGAATAGLPLIDLVGADNVTVDGVNAGGDTLTIANTTASPTTGTATIRFVNGATSNVVTNASIQGSFSGAVTVNGGNIYFATDATTANGNDNNTISNCDIGPAGVNLPTKGVYLNGSTTPTAINNSGIVINNNNIHDYFGASVSSGGIYVNGGATDCNFTNNRLYQAAPRTQVTTGTQHSGIWISNTSGNNFLVSGNTIGFATSAGTGTYAFVGVTSSSVLVPIFLSVGTTTATSVQGNTIAGIAMSGVVSGTSSAAAFRGIYVGSGLTTIGDVTGNTIGSQSATGSITYTSSATVASDVIGIFNFGSSAWTVSNNTVGGILVANSTTGASNVYGIRVNTGSGVTFICTNNTVGGTVANSLQSTSTAVGTIVQGILNNNPIGTITGNTIRNLTAAGGTGTTTTASVAGIVTTQTSTQTVSQNTIFNLSNTNATAATVVTGIQFTGSTTNVVARNRIYGLTSATTSATAEVNGIRVGGGTTVYRNNMIAVGAGIANSHGAAATNAGTTGVNGILEALGTNSFFHNSVYIGGSPTAGAGASYAFNGVQTAVTRSFRDNIFFNGRSNTGATGKHYAVKINGTVANPAGLTINNNLYFVNGTGGVFGFYNSLDVANIGAWRTAVGQDLASFESNPQYLDPTNATPDLHLNPGIATVAEGNGADVGVVDDFDGQTRASFTPVDIGADAGNFIGIDLLGPTITYTPVGNSTNTTSRVLPISVTDASGVPVAGIGLPVLYYRKNAGAYTAAQCSSTGGSNYDCTFTYASVGGVVVGDTISYYVAAQDNAGNVSVNPSAGAGGLTANPPAAATPPTTPNSFKISTALSGPYTVGPAATYLSLTNVGGAFEAINNGVLTGNVTLKIVADLTAETGTVALNQWAEEGAGNWTLSIIPSDGSFAGAARTISGVSTTALIKLNGADRVTIDGLNTNGDSLAITNTSVASGHAVIWLASLGTGLGANNDTIRNCTITAGSNTVTSYGICVGGATLCANGADNDTTTITGNTFNKAFNGVIVVGTAATSIGGVDGLSISGNNVGPAAPGANNIGGNGILIANAVAPSITLNTVRNVSATASSTSGIALNGGVINAIVSQNTVSSVITAGSSASAFGILAGTGSTGAQITRNFVTRIENTNTAGWPARGIYVNTGTASSALSIVNNSVSDVVSYSDTQASLGFQPLGIAIDGTTGGVSVYHNSVNLFGTHPGLTTATFTAAFYVSSAATGLDVRNNAFANTYDNTSSATDKNYAIYSLAPAGSYTTINNNDYYAAGAAGVLGFLGSDRTTLGAWQGATGQDGASIAADPSYNSTTNLQPNLGSPLLGAGQPIGSVPIDITGASRSGSAPTIGAYENAVDISGPVITYTAFGNTTSFANRPLAVTVTDGSGVPTAGIGLPVIYFRKGIVGAYSSAQCSFVSGSNYSCVIDHSAVGGVAPGDTIQYYVAAQDNIGNVSVQPSAGAAGLTANPPAAGTPPTSPSSYLISLAYVGSYTVGTGGTYASLTNPGGIFEAINNGVLTGNVTIDIVSNLIGETGVVALNQWAEEGSGGYTLTIEPFGGSWSVTGDSTTASVRALIRINGADRVRINGDDPTAFVTARNLTITNNDVSTASAVIWVSSGATGAQDVRITNTVVVGSGNTQTFIGIGFGGAAIASLGTDNDNNRVENCDIQKLAYGVISQGASAANKDFGLVVTRNVMVSAGANSIGRGAILASFTDSAQITENSIGNIVFNVTGDVFGISLGGLIGWGNTTVSGGSEVTNSIVERNKIGTVRQSNTYSAVGILVTPTTTGTNRIANNFISGVIANGTTPDFGAGIFIIDSGTDSSTQVYHNSISMSGSDTLADQPQYALAVNGTDPSLDVRNNIFVNTQSTGAANISYAVGLGYSTFANLTANWNDLFVTTSGNFRIGRTGSITTTGGTNQDPIATWKTATGQDANSFSAVPGFVSTTDLHLASPGLSPVENQPSPLPAVPIDIDSETRNAFTPDLGGDEVDRCAGVVCPSNTECTTYACNPADGLCEPTFAGNTTTCGDPDSSFCNAQDTCDGAGNCVDRKKALNDVCLPGNASGCDPDDVCDGTTNVCAPNIAAEFAPCGDPDSSFCNAADSCNATGSCIDRKKAANTVCLPGDASGCNPDDVCDGTTNACAPVIAPDGTACDDSDICTGQDVCTGGACVGPTLVTVSSNNLHGWSFTDDNTDGPGTGMMVAGPGTPPLGTGSVRLALNGNPGPSPAADRQIVSTFAYGGTRFADISKLKYSTYRSSVDAGNNLAITLQFDVDFDGTDANFTFQGRLVFEPTISGGGGGLVPQNTWQTWDARGGKWYATRLPFSNLCSMASPCTRAQVLSNWPNVGIHASIGAPSGGPPGRLILKAGGAWPNFDGNADALMVGVLSTETTYNFEATDPCNDGSACTVDTCSANSCVNTPVAEFTACGDPDNTACNAADSCNATGTCVDRKKTANTVCLPGDMAGCNPDDVCDGTTNVCAPIVAAEFAPCGNSDSAACNAPDSCNATGSCIDRKKPANTVCSPGDASGCNPDDVCDGTTNACAPVIAPDGTTCNDSNICTGQDVCTGGACAGPTLVTVSSNNLHGWSFTDDNTDGPGTGTFVAGPGTPPLGTGSVRLALNGNPGPSPAADRQITSTFAYGGTRFADISKLKYSTYRSSVDAGNSLAITLQFDADFDVTDGNFAFQGRLVFEPTVSGGGGGLVPQNTWQTWDARAGKWYATRIPFSNLCSMASPCTRAQVLSNWPNVGIHASIGAPSGGPPGRLILKAGGPWPNFDGNADALIVGVLGTETTYDFEATDPCNDSSACTVDTCSANSCVNTPVAEFTACGDPDVTACNAADSCNATGACVDRKKTANTVCFPGDASGCNPDDVCDGTTNVCAPLVAAEFFPCGDPGSMACNAADSCNATGSCIDRKKPANTVCSPGDASGCNPDDVCDGTTNSCAPVFAAEFTACGDPGSEACDAADSCNASGSCVDRIKPANAVCLAGDASGCNPDDLCDGSTSACTPVYTAEFTACGDSDSSVCNAADSCNATGSCVDRKKPANTLCLPASGDCDVDDVCDGNNSLCPPAYQPSTLECRPSSAPCDPAEFCSGKAPVCPADAVNASTAVGDSVRLSHNKMTAVSTISWNEAAPGPFNVYRGAHVDSAPWQYNHGCYAQGLNTQSTTSTVSPASGQMFYFLVSRDDTHCPESSLGPDSAGSDRPNTASCPNPGTDVDFDGVIGALDNCPNTYNPSQSDIDMDARGDACDNCIMTPNQSQTDLDGDGQGDACDNDIDGDGVTNGADNCPRFINPTQTDTDGDGVGDECDNCPVDSNPGQTDSDNDGIGDACD